MNYYTIVIQIKLSNNNLGIHELDIIREMHSIEEHFDGIFAKMENGYCDSGQIGTEKMEIFFDEITDIEPALKDSLFSFSFFYFN